MTCIDVDTGKRIGRGGRYGFGQILLANDLFIVQAETGSVHLVEASPNWHQELGQLTALEDRTWNQPVLARHHLLIRNDRMAICYQLSRK